MLRQRFIWPTSPAATLLHSQRTECSPTVHRTQEHPRPPGNTSAWWPWRGLLWHSGLPLGCQTERELCRIIYSELQKLVRFLRTPGQRVHRRLMPGADVPWHGAQPCRRPARPSPQLPRSSSRGSARGRATVELRPRAGPPAPPAAGRETDPAAAGLPEPCGTRHTTVRQGGKPAYSQNHTVLNILLFFKQRLHLP